MDDLVIGADALARCGWVGSAEDYLAYHDDEWGRPVRDSTALFEKISLEAFQSGLSWLTILRKRSSFRTGFDGFDPSVVAAYGPEQIERLMANATIVRNRAKIEATIANARAVLNLGEDLSELIWSFAPAPRARPAGLAEVPAVTEDSRALAAALKQRGFCFVGPTTAYALMQACGLVDDHLIGCRTAPPRRGLTEADAPAR